MQICTGNPKQVWVYDDPSPEGNVHTEITEEEILDRYYPYWYSLMSNGGRAKQELLTSENCIDDYLIMHWACKKEEYNV